MRMLFFPVSIQSRAPADGTGATRVVGCVLPPHLTQSYQHGQRFLPIESLNPTPLTIDIGYPWALGNGSKVKAPAKQVLVEIPEPI